MLRIKPGELAAMLKQKPKYSYDSPSSSSDSEDEDTDIDADAADADALSNPDAIAKTKKKHNCNTVQHERMLVHMWNEHFNQLEEVLEHYIRGCEQRFGTEENCEIVFG